jgi:fucose 4-O-acetylase-like acetyltransferase
MVFLLWTVVAVDLLPAALAAGLIAAAHHWSRSPRAFHAWTRALSTLGAQLILLAVLMALLLLAIFLVPDSSDTRPIPLSAYLAAILWCTGPTVTGLALRAASRGLRRKAERVVTPIELEAFS